MRTTPGAVFIKHIAMGALMRLLVEHGHGLAFFPACLMETKDEVVGSMLGLLEAFALVLIFQWDRRRLIIEFELPISMLGFEEKGDLHLVAIGLDETLHVLAGISDHHVPRVTLRHACGR
jgi:hypothetical protein